jgi:hypothetical protein
MAEIKSTLDIIMERTKNLTMTDKEKASFKRKEAEGKVKGWIQKYQDGIVELDALRSEFTKEITDYPDARQIFKAQLLDCLRLTGDNGRILRLFEDILGINTNPIKNTIQSLKQEMEILRMERMAAVRDDLRGKKISGSSVVPNPDRDGYLQESILKAESELRKRLKSLEG